MKKRLISLVILIVGIGLIIKLSQDIWRLLKADDRLTLAEEKLEELEKEHQVFLGKREYYQSEEFVEEESRNKLNMAREGETVVILPPNVGELLSGGQIEDYEEELPNWQKWWNLYF